MKDQQKQKKENLEVEAKDKKNFLKKCKNCNNKETEDYKA